MERLSESDSRISYTNLWISLKNRTRHDSEKNAYTRSHKLSFQRHLTNLPNPNVIVIIVNC